eukprot:scaffold2609_cov24-Tisochrysis_lutea.AAC.2
MDERRRLAAVPFEMGPLATPIGRGASGRREAPPAKARPSEAEPKELVARGSNLKFGRGRLFMSALEADDKPLIELETFEIRSSLASPKQKAGNGGASISDNIPASLPSVSPQRKSNLTLREDRIASLPLTRCDGV